MGALKDGRYPIELDKERHILFSLNLMETLDEKYGGFEKLPELMTGKTRIPFIKWFLTELLNEGAAEGEEPLEADKVGKMIHAGNLNNVVGAIFSGCSYAVNGTDEIEPADEIVPDSELEDDETENPKTGQPDA